MGTWERGVIPLEDEHTQATVEPFLQVTNASVKVIYGRTKSDPTLRLEVSAAGQLNGAPLRLSFSAEPELPAGLWAPPDGVKGSASSASGFGLDAVRAADLFIAGLELPTAQSHPALLHSARLPGALAEAFEHYQPRGKINLRLRILPLETRGADSEPLSGVARITGELEALGATCRYYEFPYEFEDARGRVRFSQGRILLENLRGRHGFGRACVNGEVFSSSSWTGFDLRFRGENIALNADLYAALPERYRPLWQSAALLGMSDVAVHISRPDGTAQAGAPSADINVDAHLLDGSLTLGDGRRLSHANGRLTIKGGTIHIHDLHGYDKETSVRLSGRIRATPDGPDTDLHVEVVDLPLEEQATLSRDPLGVTPADMTEPAKQSSIVNRQSSVRFEGRADAWGRVHGTGTAAGRQQHFAVHIKDGELHALDPERSWTESAGWVIVRDDRQQIVSFTCCQDDAWFDAAGMVPNAAQPGTPLTLDLHARGQALERLLPQFVPRDWADLTESLGLTGAGDVLVLLRPTAAGAAAGQGADIHLRADRMQAEPLPLGLRDVTAHVTLAPGNFELRSADASWGTDGKIQAQGDGSWQTDEVEVDLSVTARGMKFCPEFNEALPDSVARLIETIALQGEFDALLDRVQISGGAQRAWHFRGHLPLRAAALHLGLELTELDGELSGECTIDPAGEVTLNTEFAIRRAKLAGRPIEHWTGQLLHAAGERWVRLDDLGGRLCDGDALCSVWIDPKTSEYELSLTLKDVSVNELFPPPNDRPECKRHGRLSGTVYLRGRGGDAGTRRGGGDLRLSGASFLHTPVLSSVSQAGTEGKRPINDTVERADLRFLWEGALIRLSRVDIQSRDLRLVGEGTWNLRDDTIRMTLVGAHPEHWPRLLLISDLVELAGQELVQYHVEGPLDSPKVTAEPLYKLNEAIRALLTGGQE
ncbi:MAG: hypothetical protein KAY37_16755 [Phycisphaerae bacterium]|nr:hypothetical protein [Phycisphaerae bacterium]